MFAKHVEILHVVYIVKVMTRSRDVNIGITGKIYSENLSENIPFEQGSFPLWIRTNISVI